MNAEPRRDPERPVEPGSTAAPMPGAANNATGGAPVVVPDSGRAQAARNRPRKVGRPTPAEAPPSPSGPDSGAETARPVPQARFRLSPGDLETVSTRRGLVELLRKKRVRVKRVVGTLRYENELRDLQVELVKMQRWVQDEGKRVAILFEGRDAAGKGGCIRRFTQHLNPRAMRVVALPKPTREERGQWYFQRYTRQLPDAGEIVFFDRSWYNRAVVEPVNEFCSRLEYDQFMRQVPEFEHMLYESGIIIIKFWFSISKDEQLRRFQSRREDPLKQWKLSPVDARAQELWDAYTRFKEEMFSCTHTAFSPWIIVKANNKRRARVESIRHVLSLLPYAGKERCAIRLAPDPNIVMRFHRENSTLD